MLKGNWQEIVAKLLEKEDFNVRVTVAENATFDPGNTRVGAWKEYIRDSLGGAYLCSRPETYKLSYVSKYSEEAISQLPMRFNGTDIITEIWDCIKDKFGIRLEFESVSGSKKVWIIVRDGVCNNA